MRFIKLAILLAALFAAACTKTDPWVYAYQPCDLYVLGQNEAGHVDDKVIGDIYDKVFGWAEFEQKHKGDWQQVVLSSEQGDGSLYTYRDEKSYFAYYSGPRSFPFCVISSSTEFKYGGNTLIGMSRLDAARVFGIDKFNEEILITDVEGHAALRLIFTGNAVAKLAFVNTYID